MASILTVGAAPVRTCVLRTNQPDVDAHRIAGCSVWADREVSGEASGNSIFFMAGVEHSGCVGAGQPHS